MLKKALIFFTLLFCALSLQVNAQKALTLDNFVKTAIKKNPAYQASAKEYLAAIEANKSAHSLEDWNLIAAGVLTGSSASPTGGFSPTYQHVATYSLGVEKYIAATGTALKFEHSNSRYVAEYPTMTIPGLGTLDISPRTPSYSPSISIQIVQPLMKNGFGLAAKNGLKLSDYATKLAALKLSEDWEDFISRLHTEYLSWQLCHINVKLYEKKTKKVENQLNLIQKQVLYGLSEELDLVQLKQKLQGYKLMLESARMACQSQKQNILLLMGSSLDQTAVPEDFVKDGPVLPQNSALAYLEENSNIKQTTDLLVAMQAVSLDTAKDGTKPDVNLIGEFKPKGYGYGFSDSLSTIGDHAEYTLTVSTARPLANNQANANAKQAELEYEKIIKTQADTLLNSKIGLATLYTNLEYMTNMVDLNKSNLELAEKRLKLEQKKFNQGRSSVYFLLQAEDDVLAAENSLNGTLFAREKVVSQIKAMTDRYLIEYKDVLTL
ncbi:MAG: TolC family protein [bacterium]